MGSSSNQSAVESIYDRLSSAIQAGDYAPGQRLIEADLTDQMGVSRGPLREAMRRLSSDGLVEIAHNRGARVRRMTRKEVLDLYETREVLEGLGARLAAAKAGAQDRKKLKGIFRDMQSAINENNPSDYPALNAAFHAAIQEMAANRQLSALSSRLNTPFLRIQFQAMMDTETLSESHKDHERIVRAICSSDEVAAEQSMRDHIRHSKARVEAMPAAYFG